MFVPQVKRYQSWMNLLCILIIIHYTHLKIMKQASHNFLMPFLTKFRVAKHSWGIDNTSMNFIRWKKFVTKYKMRSNTRKSTNHCNMPTINRTLNVQVIKEVRKSKITTCRYIWHNPVYTGKHFELPIANQSSFENWN